MPPDSASIGALAGNTPDSISIGATLTSDVETKAIATAGGATNSGGTTQSAQALSTNNAATNNGNVTFNNPLSTFTPFNRVIPAGRSGWMKFWGVDDARGSDKALFGSVINFNANAGSSPSAFNQGHNLHKLTLTDKATIVIPVFVPTC